MGSDDARLAVLEAEMKENRRQQDKIEKTLEAIRESTAQIPLLAKVLNDKIDRDHERFNQITVGFGDDHLRMAAIEKSHADLATRIGTVETATITTEKVNRRWVAIISAAAGGGAGLVASFLKSFSGGPVPPHP